MALHKTDRPEVSDQRFRKREWVACGSVRTGHRRQTPGDVVGSREHLVVPVGLGDPVYDKLDADLAKAMMTINAVKGVEIGNGFEAAELTGIENADEMRLGDDGKPVFGSNHAGGILGGIFLVVTFTVGLILYRNPARKI